LRRIAIPNSFSLERDASLSVVRDPRIDRRGSWPLLYQGHIRNQMLKKVLLQGLPPH
jgi:hypothetical protein